MQIVLKHATGRSVLQHENATALGPGTIGGHGAQALFSRLRSMSHMDLTGGEFDQGLTGECAVYPRSRQDVQLGTSRSDVLF